jgi:conjugative transfer pilus assembly protein TraH
VNKFEIFLVFVLLNVSVAQGGVLDDIWKNIDTNNKSSPASMQDQQAGYWSGGSGSIRSTNKTQTLGGVVLPSITSGDCNRISVFGGGLSLIKGSEISNIAKDIGAAAPVYAMHLALKTFAPQIENTLKDLRNLLTELSGMSINTCQATRAMFAYGLPKTSALQETVCTEMATDQTNMDFAAGRNACKRPEKLKQGLEKAESKDKDLLLYNANLFKIAAEKTKIPEELMNYAMSMLGTVVVKEGKVTIYKSLITNEKSWNSYLVGGDQASLYICNDGDKCLDILYKDNITIDQDNSYKGKTQRKLIAIKEKLIGQKEDFDTNELNFLTSISGIFPIFNYIVLEAVSNTSILDVTSEVVTNYVLLSHINNLVTEINRIVLILKEKQYDPKHLIEYSEELEKVRQIAINMWDKNGLKVEQIITNAERIEKHIISKERN